MSVPTGKTSHLTLWSNGVVRRPGHWNLCGNQDGTGPNLTHHSALPIICSSSKTGCHYEVKHPGTLDLRQRCWQQMDAVFAMRCIPGHMCIFLAGHTLCARTCESFSSLAVRFILSLWSRIWGLFGGLIAARGLLAGWLAGSQSLGPRLVELACLLLCHACLPCLEGVEWPGPAVFSQSPPPLLKDLGAPALTSGKCSHVLQYSTGTMWQFERLLLKLPSWCLRYWILLNESCLCVCILTVASPPQLTFSCMTWNPPRNPVPNSQLTHPLFFWMLPVRYHKQIFSLSVFWEDKP